MEKSQEARYIKRTQKDYSMSFKLEVVQAIEQGKTSIIQVKKDYAMSRPEIAIHKKYPNGKITRSTLH